MPKVSCLRGNVVAPLRWNLRISLLVGFAVQRIYASFSWPTPRAFPTPFRFHPHYEAHRTGSNSCPVSICVLDHTNLTAHHHAISNRDASTQTGLRGDDDVLTQTIVVTDVHEVIDFCSSPDSGFV